mgnify:CR=1 FL=1
MAIMVIVCAAFSRWRRRMTSFSLTQASSRTPAVIPRQSRTNWAFSERVSRNVCIQTILCDKNEKHLKRSSGAAAGRPDIPPAPPKKIFFHPDCTVGTGITPVQLSLADFTAGREFHPALKIFIIYFDFIILLIMELCNTFI